MVGKGNHAPSVKLLLGEEVPGVLLVERATLQHGMYVGERRMVVAGRTGGGGTRLLLQIKSFLAPLSICVSVAGVDGSR